MATVVYAPPSLEGSSQRNADVIHNRMLSVVLGCRPSSVLEIGCGEGYLGSKMVEHGIRYVGIEPVDEPFQAACRSHPSLQVIQASCYDDPADLGLGAFDLVYSNDVIEHLYQPRKLVSFCKAHLKPGGSVVCCTPDYGSYVRNLLLSLFNRWDHHHSPLWDGGHIKFFSKNTLHQIFGEVGFDDFAWGSIPSPRLSIMAMSIYCIARLSSHRKEVASAGTDSNAGQHQQ